MPGSRSGTSDRSGKRSVALELRRDFFLQAIRQPLFQLILRALRNVDKADADMAGSIGPCDLALQLKLDIAGRKREAKLGFCLFRQATKKSNGHAPLAHVGGGGG